MIIIREGKSYELTAGEMEEAFRERDLKYMKEDAESHCANFNEWHERHIAFTEDDYEAIANEYTEEQDCGQTENAVYEAIVDGYVDKHFNLDDTRKEEKQ